MRFGVETDLALRQLLCTVVCEAADASGATIRNFGCFVLAGRTYRE